MKLLELHLPDADIWFYGSRAKGGSRPQSDLDMVVFSGPEQKYQVADLKEAFEESNLPFRVDLHIWDEVPDNFKKIIEDEHVSLAEIRPHSVSAWESENSSATYMVDEE
ncbi:MAG: nucleotidyltransferase domain-containing protein [Candidatus Adiutrix sp.]|nr:nucleotidyltransferase domain-containing protein [Candidatus Adiutrix sp.]